MTELIHIKGTIVDHTDPFKVPGKRYSIMFITVECPITDKSGQPEDAYYTFKVYRDSEIKKVFRKGLLECTISRESKIWSPNGHWKMKDEKVFDSDGEKVVAGRVPIILENYKLVGEMVVEMPESEKPMFMNGMLDGEDEEDDLPF